LKQIDGPNWIFEKARRDGRCGASAERRNAREKPIWPINLLQLSPERL